MKLPEFHLAPEQASSMAGSVDHLTLFLTLFTLFISLLIAGAILYFAIRYRRREGRPKGAPISGNLPAEIIWTVLPLVIAMGMFYWGARVYFELAVPPAGSMEVYGIGKQWMWKFQHPAGQSEINELHVPVGQPVKVTLTSEDVIHSFFVPAFRIKTDVLPGRYRTVWFQALRPGSYRLFCTEYCGTNHSGMGGFVIAMPQAEYAAWQATGRSTGTIATVGEKLFQQLACNTCHRNDMQGRAPVLEGLFGKPVPLRDGRTVVADETYIRESILAPESQIAAGFEPIMPSFRGLLSEEQVLELVAYIKSLEQRVSESPALRDQPKGEETP